MTENEMKRPSWVVFAAILMFLVGMFSLVFAISSFSNASWLNDYKVDIGGRLWLSGIVLIALTMASFYAGYALLQGKKFGFHFAIGYAVLSGAFWFFVLFWFPIMGLVNLAVDGLIIFALSKSWEYFDDYSRLGM